ncbi:hypothetical protein HDU67_006625 [Dinochytrium kinnereticum]|nr:hypothetical protein HDU67_006625 [Dinochytrium kinnereticum]
MDTIIEDRGPDDSEPHHAMPPNPSSTHSHLIITPTDIGLRAETHNGRTTATSLKTIKTDRSKLPATDPLRFSQPQQYLLAGYSRPISGLARPVSDGLETSHRVSRPCSPERSLMALGEIPDDDIQVDAKRLVQVVERFSTRRRAARVDDDKLDKGKEEEHRLFMKEADKCVSRPGSPMRRELVRGKKDGVEAEKIKPTLKEEQGGRSGRPKSAPSFAGGRRVMDQQCGVKGNEGKGRPSSSSVAKPRTICLNPKRIDTRSVLAPSSRPSSSRLPPSRPFSAPARHSISPSKASIKPVSFTAEEALVIRAFFRRKVSEASHMDQDASHYRLVQLEADAEKRWDAKAFSVERFIRDYVALAKEGAGKPGVGRQKIPMGSSMLFPIGVGDGRGAGCGECGSSLHSTVACTKVFQEDSVRGCMNTLLRAPYDRTHQELRNLFRLLRQLKAFEKLSDFILGELCRVIKGSRYEANRVVFKQGDPGTAWFVILSGSVSVQISKTGRVEEGVVVRQLHKGEGFGELALATDAPRSATIITDERSEIIRVEKDDYNKIIKSIHQKENIEMYSFIRRMPVFANWTKAAIMSISLNMKVRKFQHGEIIYKQGDDLKWFYIVKTGHVSVQKSSTHNGRQEGVIVEVIHPLDYFGEEGVLGADGTTSTQARCTMIAGDVRRMSKMQLIQNLAKDAADMSIDMLEATATKPPSLSRNHVGCEVIYTTAYDVRQNFRTVLELSAFTMMRDVDVLAKHSAMAAERKWLGVRKKAMDSMVRETRKDPTTNIDIVRKKAVTVAKAWAI